MMDDLISRQAALDALGDIPMSWADTDAEIQAQEDWKQHREALLKLPTAEKRGKWILTDFPDEQTYKCSACNEIWIFIVGAPVDNGAFFCPNCGARMEESE